MTKNPWLVLKNLLQNLWYYLKIRKAQTNQFERGVFQYDEELKRMVKVADAPKTEGKYAMPLAHYLERKNHVSKGSWQRPTDKRYAKFNNGDDFGKSGCRDGVGYFHPLRNGRCLYCGLTLDEVKRKQIENDKRKEANQ